MITKQEILECINDALELLVNDYNDNEENEVEEAVDLQVQDGVITIDGGVEHGVFEITIKPL